MEDQVRDYISISITVVLVASLLTLVMILTSASRNILVTRIDDRVNQRIIEEYQEIYVFDDKEVKGSDIPDAIIKYARYYDFIIDIDGDIQTINLDTEKIVGEKVWTQEYLTKDVLGRDIDGNGKIDIYENYRATIIRDDYKLVKGIKFVKE